MDADGSNQMRLTFNPAQDALPDWSPDGSLIAFNTNRDMDIVVPNHPQETAIYVIAPDGSNPTRLTHGPRIDAGPSWSPDGTQMIFHSNRAGEIDLYVMNADGSGQTNLTEEVGNGTFGAWSPDGTMIVFNSNRADAFNADVYVMSADGGDVTRLTTDPAFDGFCVWQVATPTSIGDCKRGGWRRFNSQTHERFKNQGRCVSFVDNLEPLP